MGGQKNSWREWVSVFQSRSTRKMPPLEADRDYSLLPDSLARSLAIFQLGESGGGTVIGQARDTRLTGIDRHYGDAVALFVAEEHRHASLLAMCVRLLGGRLLQRNWTDRLFVAGRRLLGLRLKILVLLAAEVVGLVYYRLLATRLPHSALRDRLLEIVDDERTHLYFHCDFLRSQTQGRLSRLVFVISWRAVVGIAARVVAFDHRRALRDLGIRRSDVLRRWRNFASLAEALVVSDCEHECAFLTLRAFQDEMCLGRHLQAESM